jgi:hypothetical protein
MYTTTDSAKVGAVEQPKMALPPEKDHYSGIYEGSPTNADRVISVDEFGNPYNADNPYPIVFDGTISVGKVQVEGTNSNTIEPNPDGSINVNVLTGSVNLDPTIVNISVPLANTEQSFTFPAKTTRFYIKPRSSHNKMQIAYISGGSSTSFITVGMGNSYAEETNMGGKTIYFQLTNASQIIELLYWKQP